MKKLFFVFLAVCLVSLFFSTTLAAKVKVGEEIVEKSGTPHPYKGGEIWQQVFHCPDVSHQKNSAFGLHPIHSLALTRNRN